MKSEMLTKDKIQKNNVFNEKEYFRINIIIVIFWHFKEFLDQKMTPGASL